MKKLITKCILFALPFLMLLVLVEFFYRFVPNNYTIKNNIIKTKYDTTEVLIFGNSHTFYGLNPDYFQKPTYNISNISQTIYFDKLLFDKHINQFKNLKYIILNVSYFSLSEIDNSTEDSWRKYYYEHYMNLDVPIINPLAYQRLFLSSTRGFNSNTTILRKYFTTKTIVDCNDDGFGINYIKENIEIKDIVQNAKERAKNHEDNLMDFTNNLNKIQEMISKCSAKGIKVILVTMPVSMPYAKAVNPIKLNKTFKSCIHLQTSNKNVIYLNLFNDNRFENTDFFDADHLHFDGATKCSKIVNQQLN